MTEARNQFPDDIWADAGLNDTGQVLARVPELMATLEQDHGAPRDPELLRRYVAETMPSGRIYLYGAGVHTRLMLTLLVVRPDIQVLGIVDRLNANITSLEGVPVIAPEILPGLEFDYLLIGHTSYEAEMVRRVKASGLDPARYRVIYGDPAFRRAARPWIEKRLSALAGHHFDALIITTRVMLLSERNLASLLPPGRTLSVFIGRAIGTEPSELFEEIDLAESLDALRLTIVRTQPRVVLIQPSIYKNFLAMAVKHWFPRLAVITEFYDFSVLWRDEDLEQLFGLDVDSRDLLHTAELVAFQQATLCISKRGGPAWDKVLARATVPYKMIFPMMTSPPAKNWTDNEAARYPDLVYAGFLPAPVMLAKFYNGYSFLTALEEVCRRGGLTVEIYNSAHIGASADDVLGDYLRAYPGPPLHYRRRLEYDALVARMAGARYGWLCDSGSDVFQADRVVGVCSRWTGYVSAGLPVLLDGSWSLMADLVRRFGAGAVVGRGEPDEILCAIDVTDHSAACAGVEKLRQHLLDHNDRTLAIVRAAILCALEVDCWTEVPKENLTG